MGRFRLYADASLSQLIVVGENQHWILNTGAARDTLKQVLPSGIQSPAAWLFSNASLAMPANMAQDEAPKVSLRFFSVYRPHALSPAQQQTLQALGYETDTNAAKHLTFMNQMVKHGALGTDEPTLNRVLFYTGKAYQASPAPAGFLAGSNWKSLPKLAICLGETPLFSHMMRSMSWQHFASSIGAPHFSSLPHLPRTKETAR